MGGKVSFPRINLDRDKTVVVTGGNTGIGYETAKWIAFLGAKVIIACRSEERANEAINKIKAEYQAEKERGTDGIIKDGDLNIEFMQLDLSSLKSTKRFIDAYKSSGRKLHVLICNAGIAMHEQAYTEDENELMFQIMQMYYMNRRLKDTNVSVLSIHPGIVETEIDRSFQDLGRWKVFFRMSKLFGFTKNPLEGAESSINAAINPDLKGTRDVYFQNCKASSTNSTARNMVNQETLLKFSLERLKDYLTEDIAKDWMPEIQI